MTLIVLKYVINNHNNSLNYEALCTESAAGIQAILVTYLLGVGTSEVNISVQEYTVSLCSEVIYVKRKVHYSLHILSLMLS